MFYYTIQRCRGIFPLSEAKHKRGVLSKYSAHENAGRSIILVNSLYIYSTQLPSNSKHYKNFLQHIFNMHCCYRPLTSIFTHSNRYITFHLYINDVQLSKVSTFQWIISKFAGNLQRRSR